MRQTTVSNMPGLTPALQAQDIILAVRRAGDARPQTVANAEELKRLVRARDLRRGFQIGVLRDGRTGFVDVEGE